MPNFREMLSANVGEVERPKPMPIGTYQLVVLRKEFGESSQKKTPFVRFFFRAQTPLEDVDQDLLPENWNTKELRTEFYLTDDALFLLSDFLQACGISGMTLDQGIEAAIGAAVQAFVTQTPSQRDPERVYNDLTTFAKVA